MQKITIYFLFTVCLSVVAQTIQYNPSDILLNLQKLNTVGSVLYIAAHPDDENTRLLAYLAKEKKLRTAYLSLTRGDGGQNLIGKEQGDALGIIRTQELLAARRVDGAEQFFTRAIDFGYSKTPEETLKFWNKDSILSDMVWVIRHFKPDVIICRFPTTGEGGHGHHTASAILALEAFEAAADPKKFPEQLNYTSIWKTKRLFWNTFNFSSGNTIAPGQLKINIGAYNSLLGKGYGEVASESRSMHKSQGFGSAKLRGEIVEYFKLLKGDSVKADLFEGIDQSWRRFKTTAKLQKLIHSCVLNFNPSAPEKTIPGLITVRKELQSIKETEPGIIYWKNLKLKEAETLLLACSGLWLEAFSNEFSGVPGNSAQLYTQIIKRNQANIHLKKIIWPVNNDSTMDLSLKTNELYTFNHYTKIPENTPFSTPYWLEKKHRNNLFFIADKHLIGQAENNPALSVKYEIEADGITFMVERGINYKYTDPIKGEVYRPFEILPPAQLNFSEKLMVFGEATTKTIQLIIKANADNVKGLVKINVPDDWTAILKQNEFSLSKKNDELIVDVSVTPSQKSTATNLSAELNINGKNYSKNISRIEYEHIPYQFMLNEAEISLIKIDLKKSGINIAYIPGAGDEIPACLKQMGYNVSELNDELIRTRNLSEFNAIITGIRAYNTNTYLQAHYEKLMSYVNNGGNFIVQYNTNSRVGPVMAKIGPYPFTISRNRVTDETAEVTFTNPAHNIFNFPNSISKKDFEGWVQERGIYFASEIDKNYESLLLMNDSNENPLAGSLITCKYGKGNFVYTGLSFFRQLPACVPGAYRLLANLLSIPQNK